MTMSAPIEWTTVWMVAAWYGSNIGVLLLNKYLLTNYGFGFPIFLTLCHMTACSVFSYVAVAVMKVALQQSVKSKVQFAKIAGLSVVFCFSVVCGNVSLRYIPVSFNQAVSATTPFFTAIFAFLIIKKREAWLTYAALIPVVAGVIFASGGEPSFHLFGFIMCITATSASSGGSTVGSSGSHDPLETMETTLKLPYATSWSWGRRGRRHANCSTKALNENWAGNGLDFRCSV